MASTEELEAQILAEMESNPEAYAVEESNVLVIDNDLRTISIPEGIKNLGVESDDDVHRLYFRMPKTYGEFDLSTFDIRVNYKNGNIGDVYAVEDKNADGDAITFSWLVGRNAVKTKNSTQFIVCLKKSDASGVVQQEFNTTVASLSVLEGLETTEQVVQENPDIIEQILKKIDGLTSISPEDIANAVAEYMSANPIDVPENLSDLKEDATHRTVTDEDKAKWDKAEENVQSDWNETDTASDSFIKNKPESLKSPQKLTFAGAVTAEYDGSGAVTVTIPESRTIRVEKSDAEAALEPGKLYVFPEMASLSITLAEPADTAVASEYHFVFQSGATATTLSLPDTIKLPSGFTVEASKIYEISILEGCLCAQSWAVS